MKPTSSTENSIELESHQNEENIDNFTLENEFSEYQDSSRLILSDKSKISYHPIDNEMFSHNIKKYFNLKTTKFVSVSFIFMFVFYHGYLNSFKGPNSCRILLEQGYFRADDVWQPSGCMVHNYSN